MVKVLGCAPVRCASPAAASCPAIAIFARPCFQIVSSYDRSDMGRCVGATGEECGAQMVPACGSAACPYKSIYDLHVRTIPRYIADFLACFAVRSADWPEEMAPKRRMSEKKLQAWAATRLNRWHDSASSHGGIEAMLCSS